MKIILTESQFKRVILKEESNDQDMMVRKMVNSQLIRRIEDLTRRGNINSYDELYSDIKRVIMKVIDMIKKDFSKDKELTFNKKGLIKHIGKSMENNPQIIKSMNRSRMGRFIDIIKQELRGFNGIEDRSVNTDVVANFDKEKVTDDLANKTTIKDGVAHVPFAIDDFPTEDWDLYFEDFNVSNEKFDFSGYLKKEYGAGDVDAEVIWNEYQEAVLHRLMDNS